MRTTRILVAWLLLCGTAAANVTPSVSVIPNAAIGQPGGVPQLNASAMISSSNLPHWTTVSTRAQFGGYAGPNITIGLRALTGLTDRFREIMPPGPGASDIRLIYSGYYSGISPAPAAHGSSGEQAGMNPVTCTASVETSSNSNLASWSSPNGFQLRSPPLLPKNPQAVSFVIPATGKIAVDMKVHIAGGQAYYPFTYCVEPVGGHIPVRLIGRGINFDATNTGYLQATFGTGNGTATTFTFTAPAAQIPILPGSVTVAVPGFANVTDNGIGGFPVGNGVAAASTVNYATGVVTLNTANAVANGVIILGNLIGGTPGSAVGGDQTQTAGLVPFSTGVNNLNNPMIGPVSIQARPALAPSLRPRRSVARSAAGSCRSARRAARASRCRCSGIPAGKTGRFTARLTRPHLVS
jgi:hypothetical protein